MTGIVNKYKELPITKTVNIRSIITMFNVIYGENFYYPGESHNFWEIVCVLDGQIGVTAGSSVYKLGKNQMILHTPMEFHNLWASDGTKPRLLIFSFFADFLTVPQERIFSLSDENVNDLCEIYEVSQNIFEFEGISIVSLKSGRFTDLQLFSNKLENFLLTAIEYNTPDFNAKSHNQTAVNYMEIVKILESNLDKSLTLDEVAAMCSMSKSNVKKTFEKYSGMGVIKYYNNLKMIEAVRLLGSGLSVSETAQRLGFSEQNYFSTVFKRILGSAPTHYIKSGLN